MTETEEKPKKKMGRPTLLTPERETLILGLYRTPLPERYIAGAAGVSLRTLQNWKQNNEEFLRKVEQARSAVVGGAVQKLWQCIEKGNLEAIKFYLRTQVFEFQEGRNVVEEETDAPIQDEEFF